MRWFELVTATVDDHTFVTSAFTIFFDLIKISIMINKLIMIVPPRSAALNLDLAIGLCIGNLAYTMAFNWACGPRYLEMIVAVICSFHLVVKLGIKGGRTTRTGESPNHTASNRPSGCCGRSWCNRGSSFGGSLGVGVEKS